MNNEKRKQYFRKAIDTVYAILLLIAIALTLSSVNCFILNISIILLLVVRIILRDKRLTVVDIVWYLFLIVNLIKPFIV